MKKLVIAISVLFLAACGGNSGNKQAAGERAAKAGGMAAETAAPEILNDSHNARNSLDYTGEYKGTLQLERAGDVNVELILTDSTFQQTVTSDAIYQLGRGKYEWNEAGNIITLVDSSVPNEYFVGENTLFPADSLGNRIASEYVLKKQ